MQNFKPLAIFYDCVAQFVTDLVGNPEDRFSHNDAHIILFYSFIELSIFWLFTFKSVKNGPNSEKCKPFVMNGLSHSYPLDESIFNLEESGLILRYLHFVCKAKLFA